MTDTTTDPENSEKIKQDKYQCRHIIFKPLEIKDKGRNLKEGRGIKTPHPQRNRVRITTKVSSETTRLEESGVEVLKC